MEIMNIVLMVVFACVGVALVVFVIELIKLLRTTRGMIDDVKTKVDPMLEDVTAMVSDVRPAVAKVDPMVDRVQLTLDAVNLEMMRVDEILEDVSQITDTASSATAAVDNLTNAPIKAVNSVATKVRSRLGSKSASNESTQLGGQRDAVARALEDYKAAQDETTRLDAVEGAQDAADEPIEPNFDGFEKLVSDAEPEALEGNEGVSSEAAASAEDIFGAAEDATESIEAVDDQAEKANSAS